MQIQYQFRKNDEYFTPSYAVYPIMKRLKAGATVWCPFDKKESEYVRLLSRHGSVFLDYRCSISPRGENLILYGHNMDDGAWFHYLVNYLDPAFVAADPVVNFNTLYEEGQYVVFGVFVAATLPQHGDDFDYHNQVSFQTMEEKQAYLDRIAKRTLLRTGVEVTPRDELLTLSTCLYDFAGERLVVAARRLRQGEAPENFGALEVVRTPNPEMPKVWLELYT